MQWPARKERDVMDDSVVGLATVIGCVDEKKGLVWRPIDLAKQKHVYYIPCYAFLAWTDVYVLSIQIYFFAKRSTQDRSFFNSCALLQNSTSYISRQQVVLCNSGLSGSDPLLFSFKKGEAVEFVHGGTHSRELRKNTLLRNRVWDFLQTAPNIHRKVDPKV